MHWVWWRKPVLSLQHTSSKKSYIKVSLWLGGRGFPVSLFCGKTATRSLGLLLGLYTCHLKGTGKSFLSYFRGSVFHIVIGVSPGSGRPGLLFLLVLFHADAWLESPPCDGASSFTPEGVPPLVCGWEWCCPKDTLLWKSSPYYMWIWPVFGGEKSHFF